MSEVFEEKKASIKGARAVLVAPFVADRKIEEWSTRHAAKVNDAIKKLESHKSWVRRPDRVITGNDGRNEWGDSLPNYVQNSVNAVGGLHTYEKVRDDGSSIDWADIGLRKPEHLDAAIEQIGVTVFGIGVAVFYLVLRLNKLPAYQGAKFLSEYESVQEIELQLALSELNNLRHHKAQNTFESICKDAFGVKWERIDSNQPCLSVLAFAIENSNSFGMGDWFRLLTLTPKYKQKAESKEPKVANNKALMSRIVDGLAPDFWHCVPSDLGDFLIEKGQYGTLSEISNSALSYNDRREDSAWSVTKVSRSLVVLAGTARNAIAQRGASRNAARSLYFKRFYHGVDKLLLEISLILSLQKAGIRLLRQATASAIALEPEKRERVINGIQERLIEFSSAYLYSGLSLREEYEFIYREWRAKLNIEAEFLALQRDVTGLYQLSQSHRQDLISKATTNIAVIALLGSIGALVTGIFGMNLLLPGQSHRVIDFGLVASVAGVALLAFSMIGRRLLFDAVDQKTSLITKISKATGITLLASGIALIGSGKWDALWEFFLHLYRP